ncbi:MAG: hypothetical protein M3P06_11495 [Acidobacteriota bacterium]|nr:hypothetical protein [Acidobacteriota bacterium]
MSGEQLLGIAAIIGAVASPFSLYMIARLSHQLAQASNANLAATARVKAEVTPNNGLTNGETVDATLTKLIQMEPRDERSARDDEHMEAMSDIDPALAKKEAEEET